MTVPRCWDGETIICIGGGPSLTDGDVAKCFGARAKVAVVNDAYRMASWADLLYGCDSAWWQVHGGVKHFQGQRWTQSRYAAQKYKINYVRSVAEEGASLNPEHVYQGGFPHHSRFGETFIGSNGGFQCVNLAVLMGAARIILLGYDMQKTGGKNHWFGDHPGALHRGMDVESWVEGFRRAAPTLQASCEILNASRETALHCFPRVTLCEALRAISDGPPRAEHAGTSVLEEPGPVRRRRA